MTKEKLNQVFEECRRTRSGIVIDLKMPNQEYPERIINHYTSLKAKQEYYNEMYDENLIHKRNELIKIISAKPIQVAFFSKGE